MHALRPCPYAKAYVLAGSLAGLLAGGCATPPPPSPPPPPALSVHADHRPGHVLAGRFDTGDEQQPSRPGAATPWLVRVGRFTGRPDGWAELPSGLDAVEVLVTPREPRPLRSAATLLADLRIADGPPPAGGEPLATETLLLVEGVAAECVLRRAGADASAGRPDRPADADPGPPGVRLALAPGTRHDLRIGLEVRGTAVPIPAEIDTLRDDDGIAGPQDIVELAMWEREVGDAGTTLLLPSPFASDDTILAVHVQRHELDGAALQALAAAAGAQIARHRAAAAAAGDGPGPDAMRERSVQDTLASTRYRAHVRRALVNLAALGHAPVAEDLALIADLDWLDRWATRLRAAATPDTPADGSEIAWLLERTACHTIVETALGEGLDMAFHGVLLRHLGEPGREPALIDALLAGCDDRETFAARLVAENRFALSSSRPATRIRAHDWLARRGLAPDGYAPLDGPAARRAALRDDSAARQRQLRRAADAATPPPAGAVEAAAERRR